MKHQKEDIINIEVHQEDDRLHDILERLENLETNQDASQNNLAILTELVTILGEIPAGKKILNRAINRQSLNYLKNVVLPRRKAQLLEIATESMPEPIKNEFIEKEINLIKSTTRMIAHRESYEKSAAINVKNLLLKVFRPKQKFLNHKEDVKCPNSMKS